MSCKSGLYASNVSTQSLAVNGVVNFGSIVRRYGCALDLSGGNVYLKSTGYYDIDANFTIVGTAAGDVTISLLQDGVPIVGANATVTTAVGTTYAVTIPTKVREMHSCGSVITAIITGAIADITNAAIDVEKM